MQFSSLNMKAIVLMKNVIALIKEYVLNNI